MRPILFAVDFSINLATNRNWQTKLLDRRKVTQLNILRHERVEDFYDSRRQKQLKVSDRERRND